MHYFKRNIGDYHKKAGRLTMLQHGAYTLLMDACYDRERFPTLDEAIDWCWASTDDEISAVKFVLSKFFDLVDGRYMQARIQEEIDDFHDKSEKNRRIALDREEKRRNRKQNVDKDARNVIESSPDVNEAPPNHKPLTKNQEPVKETPDGVGDAFDAFWQAYPKKVGKEAARKAFSKVKRPTETLDMITDALAWQTKSEQWVRDGGQYIPNPATYLNQARWMDEPNAAPSRKVPASENFATVDYGAPGVHDL